MRVRAILALAIASLWLLVAPASSAQAALGPYPPTTCATLAVSTTHPLEGASITVTGAKFAANATIKLVLKTKTYLLATVKSDANGAFSVLVKLPAGVLGHHLIVAEGGDTGCPPDPVQIVIQPVSAPSSSSGGGGGGGGTAFTGVDILALLVGAGVLIGAGVLFNRRGTARRAASRY